MYDTMQRCNEVWGDKSTGRCHVCRRLRHEAHSNCRGSTPFRGKRTAWAKTSYHRSPTRLQPGAPGMATAGATTTPSSGQLPGSARPTAQTRKMNRSAMAAQTATTRAAIQGWGSILAWTVILSVYGADTIATHLSLSALISWFMKLIIGVLTFKHFLFTCNNFYIINN
jgi:hypothetical protein